MALKETIKENLYIKSLISQIPVLKQNLLKTDIIYTDSMSSIELAKNPIYHARSKHIDIQYHFVRENYLNKIVNLIFIPTSIQLADCLTKVISNTKWKNFLIDIKLLEKEEVKEDKL
jgi:hypothetical protein